MIIKLEYDFCDADSMGIIPFSWDRPAQFNETNTEMAPPEDPNPERIDFVLGDRCFK